MKNFKGMVAFVALVAASPVVAAGTQDCGNSEACHYNDASINKGDTSNTQNVGDHQNNTYAPDSATANAHNDVTIGDNIAQGGTGGSANASGNTSTNHNQSNANNSLSNQQFGNSSAHTGNNTNSIGDQNFNGSNTMGDMTGNVSGTNTNTVNSAGGSVAGSGNSSNHNDNKQGQQQGQVATSHGGQQRQTSTSNARGGNQSQSANNQGNSQNTNIDASTRVRHSASTAYAPGIIGYGPGNCFGDTNPSGSFSAGMQTFGWGVTAGAAKATNVCAIYAVGGPGAAAAYLATMDRNAHKALVAAGVVTTPSRVRAAAKAEKAPLTAYSRCEMQDGRLHVTVRRGHDRDLALSQCQSATVRPQQAAVQTIPTCPEGSKWDGKGCWMPYR